jgi:hypothetical protein
MPKDSAISVRVTADIKGAAEKAATADRRSLASLVEKILAEWLRANGYLKKPRPDKGYPEGHGPFPGTAADNED